MSAFIVCLREGVPADPASVVDVLAPLAPNLTRSELLTALRSGGGFLFLRLDRERAEQFAARLNASGHEARILDADDARVSLEEHVVRTVTVHDDALEVTIGESPQRFRLDALVVVSAGKVRSLPPEFVGSSPLAPGVRPRDVLVQPEPWLDLVFGPELLWLRLPLARLQFKSSTDSALSPAFTANFRRLLGLVRAATPRALRLGPLDRLEEGQPPERLPSSEPIVYYRVFQWLHARARLWEPSALSLQGASGPALALPKKRERVFIEERAWVTPVTAIAAAPTPAQVEGAHLERLRPPGPAVMLPAEGVLLGRQAGASLRLDFDGVAARHAQVDLRNGEWTLTPFAPVFVNGVLTRAPVALMSGQALELGKAALRFVNERGAHEEQMLEEWLEAPADVQRTAVLADALLERGDPLGRLFGAAATGSSAPPLRNFRAPLANGALTVTSRGALFARIALRQRIQGVGLERQLDPLGVLDALLTLPNAQALTELAIDVPPLVYWVREEELLQHLERVAEHLAGLRLHHLRRLSLGYRVTEQPARAWELPADLRAGFPRLRSPVVFEWTNAAELIVERPGLALTAGQRFRTRSSVAFEADRDGAWRAATASVNATGLAVEDFCFRFRARDRDDVRVDQHPLRTWGVTRLDDEGDLVWEAEDDYAALPVGATAAGARFRLLPGDRVSLPDGALLRFELAASM